MLLHILGFWGKFFFEIRMFQISVLLWAWIWNSQPGSENKRQKETLLTLEIRRGCEITEDDNCPHRGPCLQIISKHARYRVILPANYSERFRYSTTDLNAFVSLRTNGGGGDFKKLHSEVRQELLKFYQKYSCSIMKLYRQSISPDFCLCQQLQQ